MLPYMSKVVVTILFPRACLKVLLDRLVLTAISRFSIGLWIPTLWNCARISYTLSMHAPLVIHVELYVNSDKN